MWVKTSLSMGTDESYLVKNDDWIKITFRFFFQWAKAIFGKNWKKKWNWHHHTSGSLMTAITIQLLRMWFFRFTRHCCNVAQCQTRGSFQLIWRTFKVENNSLELIRIFKESFKDQRWAWEKSVRAEKRDRDAEREKETFRRQRHHQSDRSWAVCVHLVVGHGTCVWCEVHFEDGCG